MRVYLDNCCYNRPFDDQAQFKVMLESLAKLCIQQQMRSGLLEYAWSSVLDFEISRSRFLDRARQILSWANGAAVMVNVDAAIRVRAKEFELPDLRPPMLFILRAPNARAATGFLQQTEEYLRRPSA